MDILQLLDGSSMRMAACLLYGPTLDQKHAASDLEDRAVEEMGWTAWALRNKYDAAERDWLRRILEIERSGMAETLLFTITDADKMQRTLVEILEAAYKFLQTRPSRRIYLLCLSSEKGWWEYLLDNPSCSTSVRYWLRGRGNLGCHSK